MDCYFGFNGELISMHDWLALFSERHDYPNGRWQVGRDTVGSRHISTVWLGLAIAVDNEQPMIYETLINNKHAEYEQVIRYPDRHAAEIGHQLAMLEAASNIC